MLGKMEPLVCGKMAGIADNLLFGASGIEYNPGL